MKLFTKEIDKKLFDQYSKGNNLESQMVVAKIFNPYGRGTWYIVNSDPEDSDYLWAIVDLFEVEIGSVLRSELESIKVPPFRLGLERDTSFRPINAKELYDGLRNGKHYAHGGSIEDENREMVLNENNQIIHHTKELPSAIKGKRVPAWVVTKVHESASDLSDATHYMDGQKMADGGEIDTNVEMIEDKDGSQYLFPKNSKNKTLGVKFDKGGEIESLNAPNSYLNIFTLGVKLPSQEKIVSSSMSPSHFSRKSLTLTLKGGSKEVIPEAKISDFLKGKQIYLRDTNGESYAIQLNRLKKMANGGNISKREETQENKFGVTYKLGDKFNLGYNVSTRPNIEVSIVEIIPSGLFFKVNNSTKLFSIKTLQSKGSTISSGEYLVPINKMAKGGGVDKTYSSAKTMGKESQDFKSEAIDYVGGIREWNKLTEEEKRQIIVDLEKDWDRNKYKKGGNVNKVTKVMHEFKEGNLHSGKSEKIVTNPKQAIAIALSEAKNNSEKKGWKHKK